MTRAPDTVPRAARRGLVPLLVGMAVLLTFWPSLQGEFLTWDDDENFVHNLDYRGLGWAQLRWMFTTTHMGPYIPLAWVTLGLDSVLWGMDPWGYHLTSVMLHAVGTVLLYFVARRLLAAAVAPPRGLAPPHPALSPAGGEGSAGWGAAVAALVWGLHPLRVESVAWITERRDVLAGVFVLLTVLAYLRAWERGRDGRLARGWLGASAGCFLLALLSKATIVGLPVALLAIDVHPLRRLARDRGRLRMLARLALVEKLPFLVIALGFTVLAVWIGAQRGMLTGLETLPVLSRLAISAYGLVFYLARTLAPWPLSPIYPLVLPVDPTSARYVACALIVAAVTVAAIAAARRWPGGLVAWTASVALALPVLGLLHNGPQIAADRYTYVPAMAWSLLPGAGAAWVARAAGAGRLGRGVRAAAPLGAAVALVALAAVTIRQEAIWRDSVSLWRHAALVEPASDIPVFYLGWSLAARGRLDEARQHFERALGRTPASEPRLRAHLQVHLGNVLTAAGDLEGAERQYREALAVDPEHAVARIRLGLTLLAGGRRADGERALFEAAATGELWARYQVSELRAAVALVPPDLPEARGRLAFALGVLLQQLGARDQAEAQYRLAVAALPRHAAAWNNLGVIAAESGRLREALEAFVRALEADPGHAAACRNGRRIAPGLGLRPTALESCRPASG